MQVPGKRVKRTRLVQSDRYVVAVEVEMVIPLDDPNEPCLEAEAVQFLREVKQHADQGNIDWLKSHGKVFAAVEAA